ncbi:MAG: metal ABC transporter substrate-binding protein, partial [Actinomycetota bacterium]
MSGAVRTLRLALALILALALVACGDEGRRESDATIRAVTTVSPITNIVQNVAGTRVQVTGIVPEGTNSHTFEPAPSDAGAMADADLVFVNGLRLEEPTIDLAEANVGDGVQIVPLGELTISPDEYIFDFSFPREQGDPNPHLWTNPPYAKRYAEIVKDRLSELDPGNAGYYEKNYVEFAERIDELDGLVRQVTETVPPENR